jgi:hypothetical protein
MLELLRMTMVQAIEAFRAGQCHAIKPQSGAHWLIINDNGHFIVEQTGKRATFETVSLDWPWVVRS